MFDIPKSPTKAAKLIRSTPAAVRVGTLRMDLTRGSVVSTHHSLFACGLGLDADVVIEADKDPYRKYRFGALHYASTALVVALKDFPGKKPHVTVSSDGQTAKVSAIVFQFRDVYTYFGRLPLSLSKSRPDPVTALMVEKLKRRRVPFIATRIFARSELGDLSEMQAWEGIESVDAIADPPVAAQADGESLGMVDAAHVEWMPKTLSVIRGHPDRS